MKRLCSNLLTLALVLAPLGCGTTEDDPTASSSETVSEIAVSSLSGAVQASDSSGAAAFNFETRRPESMVAQFVDLVQPFPSAFAATATCDANSVTNCTAGVSTATYSGCSFKKATAVWTGSQIVTFKTPSGSCPALGQFYASGNDFIRTFSAGTTRVNNGVTVTFDTAAPLGVANLTGVTGATGGGTEVVMGPSGRTITINGIHYTATKTVTTNKGTSKVKTVWEHIVDTTVPVSVSRAGTVHTVNSGTVRVQHMLAKYVATATSNAITYDTSTGCCHPTSGTLTSKYADSAGTTFTTEILSFASTATSCGAATIQTGTGTTQAAADTAAAAATASALTMSHCF
jgi:hypothetical protein